MNDTTRRVRFKVKWWKRNRFVKESEPFDNIELAIAFARSANTDGASGITILRDSGGTDHPSNAGKFFLHLIIK